MRCDVSCLAPTTCWEVDTTVLRRLYGTDHRWELADDVRLPTMVRRCDVSCLAPTPGGRLIRRYYIGCMAPTTGGSSLTT